jgi:acyl-CoA synthetase (NDP forming)
VSPLLPGATRMLPEPEAAELLQAHGIEYVPHLVATTAEDAGDAADRLGCPVVLKIVSSDIIHKSDVGGVVMGLSSAEEVRDRFDPFLAAIMACQPGARLDGALVCRQVEAPGAEMIIGAARDATFGATVMVGAGGVFKTLTGYRNVPPLDVDGLLTMAVKLGDLLCELPEVAEVDLNPVKALADGCLVLDARVLVAHAPSADAGPAVTEADD